MMSEVFKYRLSSSLAREIVALSRYQTKVTLRAGIEMMLVTRAKTENDYPNPRDIEEKFIMLARIDLTILQMCQILQQKEEEETREQ